MLYLLPAATVVMLGYIFWRTAFRLRHDRLKVKRTRSRGKFRFSPRERLRSLLNASFAVPEERPDWENRLVSRLTDTPVGRPPEAAADPGTNGPQQSGT